VERKKFYARHRWFHTSAALEHFPFPLTPHRWGPTDAFGLLQLRPKAYGPAVPPATAAAIAATTKQFCHIQSLKPAATPTTSTAAAE